MAEKETIKLKCEDCYRYLQCWACKMLDVENDCVPCKVPPKMQRKNCFDCNDIREDCELYGVDKNG